MASVQGENLPTTHEHVREKPLSLESTPGLQLSCTEVTSVSM